MEQQVLQAGCEMTESQPGHRGQPIGTQQLSNIPIRQFPPIPAPQFHQMHKAYLDRNGVHADRRQPSIQGVLIDLHILHAEMMKVGGLLNLVNAYSRPLDDIFAIIGGKCGIVHRPAEGKELPKCNQASSAALQQIYKTYLFGFDMAYLKSKMSQMGIGQQVGFTDPNSQMNAGASTSSALRQNSQPAPTMQNPANSPLMRMVAANGADPKKLDELLTLVMLPPEELRARNLPDDLRRTLAIHGPYLKQMAQNQQQYMTGIQLAAQRLNTSPGNGMPTEPPQNVQQLQQQPAQGVIADLQGHVSQQGQMVGQQTPHVNGVIPNNWPGQCPDIQPMTGVPQQPGESVARPPMTPVVLHELRFIQKH